MPKAGTAQTKPTKKPVIVVDRDALLLLELEKTKKTISDASVVLSKSLTAVVASGA